MRAIGFLLALLGLGGCGGGGGGGAAGGGGPASPPPDPRLARLDAYEAQRLRVLGSPGAGITGLPDTDPLLVPVVGVADYAGGATIRVETDTPLVLYGDARITVDFDDMQVTGTMDRFFGTTNNGSVANYSGAIAISGTTATQNMDVGYSGALSAAGQTVTLNGVAEGVFLGADATALTLSDLEAEAFVAGLNNDATLVVVTEIEP